MKLFSLTLLIFVLTAQYDCNNQQKKSTEPADTISTKSDSVVLPQPYATKSVQKFSKVIGWQQGKMPVAPQGFTVSAYATGLVNPRNVYVAANGDVFVAESNTELSGIKKIAADISGITKSQRIGSSANRITLLRDTNLDGKPDIHSIYISNLNQPYGILIIGNKFYVGNTDGLLEYPYNADDTVMKAKGKKILDLPAGGYNNHWTRNIIANKNNTKIFVAVGSGSNVAEHGISKEMRRANILEINPDGSGEVVYASGLRNPNGLTLQPNTGTVYTSVNERDELGDDLVPDYFTSVKQNGFYGWPYSYFGQHKDPRMKDNMRNDLVAKAIVPDVALGSHVAALGTVFYNGNMFPAKYKDGAFVSEHGSWNRSALSGYKVVFVPFENGKPGKPEDFLTGFIADENKKKVYGRPVNMAFLKDGSLLLADDSGNTIWRVSYSR